jgi:biotin transport system substrate-specific component
MNRSGIRGLVFCALFAAIFMALSNVTISLPFTTVPISLIGLGTMLAGALLGARLGFLAVLLALGIAAAGLPVIGGKSGLALLLGFSAGYVWVAPIAAGLIGFFSERIQQSRFAFIKLTAVNFLFGSLLLYPTGVWWLAHKMGVTSLSKALTAGFWPFLPGDILKCVVAAAVTVAVTRVYPIERIVGSQNAAR